MRISTFKFFILKRNAPIPTLPHPIVKIIRIYSLVNLIVISI